MKSSQHYLKSDFVFCDLPGSFHIHCSLGLQGLKCFGSEVQKSGNRYEVFVQEQPNNTHLLLGGFATWLIRFRGDFIVFFYFWPNILNQLKGIVNLKTIFQPFTTHHFVALLTCSKPCNCFGVSWMDGLPPSGRIQWPNTKKKKRNITSLHTLHVVSSKRL